MPEPVTNPVVDASVERAQDSQTILAQNPQTAGNLNHHVKLMWEVIIGIVVVLTIATIASLIAVGGMIVNYEAERQATFQDLKDQVTAQNAKIDALTNVISKQETISR